MTSPTAAEFDVLEAQVDVLTSDICFIKEQLLSLVNSDAVDGAVSSGVQTATTQITNYIDNLVGNVNDTLGAYNLTIQSQGTRIDTAEASFDSFVAENQGAISAVSSLQSASQTAASQIVSLQNVYNGHAVSLEQLQASAGTFEGQILALNNLTANHASQISTLQTTTEENRAEYEEQIDAIIGEDGSLVAATTELEASLRIEIGDSATATLTTAQQYTDGEILSERARELQEIADQISANNITRDSLLNDLDQALRNYTDQEVTAANTYADGIGTASNAYSDGLINAEVLRSNAYADSIQQDILDNVRDPLANNIVQLDARTGDLEIAVADAEGVLASQFTFVGGAVSGLTGYTRDYIDTAQQNAESHANTQAVQAEQAARGYADGLDATNRTYTDGQAAQAEQAARGYADGLDATNRQYTDAEVLSNKNAAIAAAESYANQLDQNLRGELEGPVEGQVFGWSQITAQINIVDDRIDNLNVSDITSLEGRLGTAEANALEAVGVTGTLPSDLTAYYLMVLDGPGSTARFEAVAGGNQPSMIRFDADRIEMDGDVLITGTLQTGKLVGNAISSTVLAQRNTSIQIAYNATGTSGSTGASGSGSNAGGSGSGGSSTGNPNIQFP